MASKYKPMQKKLYALHPEFCKLHRRRWLRFGLENAAIWAVVLLFAWQSRAISPVAPITALAVGILLSCLLLLRSKLLVRGCLGRVTDTKQVIRGVHRYGGVVRYSGDMMQKNFTVFTLTDENGRSREIELEERYERTFCKGDCLILLPEVQYPINITTRPLLCCPFCGNISPKENTVCMGCGTSTLHLEGKFEVP